MVNSFFPPSPHYLPEGGLAAANTEVLLLSMVVMPALAIEMVCCSIACMENVWQLAEMTRMEDSNRDIDKSVNGDEQEHNGVKLPTSENRVGTLKAGGLDVI